MARLVRMSFLEEVVQTAFLLLSGVIKTTLKNILLWLTFVLLVIYSLAVVTLIILKKVNDFDIFLWI